MNRIDKGVYQHLAVRLLPNVQPSKAVQPTKDIYRHYEELSPKRKPAFCEQHRADIVRHESAVQYFRKVLNGHTVISIKQWTKEAAEIGTNHATMYLSTLS